MAFVFNTHDVLNTVRAPGAAPLCVCEGPRTAQVGRWVVGVDGKLICRWGRDNDR
jgi:hypothetical protein